MRLSRRNLLGAGAAAALMPAFGAGAGTAYPARAVRVLVPYAPGGPADILARLIAPKLSTHLGQAFFVENVGGAGGNIGMGQGARAAADGHTVLVVPPNIIVNPAMYPTVPYDPYRDFRPVSIAVAAPTVLTVHPSVKADTVKDLVALIRSNPRKYSFASPGTGTPPHLIGEQFRLSCELELVHVPFNSAGQAVASAVGGHTPLAFSSLPPAVPLVKDGKLRALAVTSRARSSALPDIPTMAEQGYPAIEGEGWFAVMVPAATPKDIVELLYRELSRALTEPDLKDKLTTLGFEVVNRAPDDSVAFLRAEAEKWTRIIRSAGIKAD